MFRKIILVAIAFNALASAGCTAYSAAAPSVQGKAYIVGQGLFSASMYHCSVATGQPVCTEQREEQHLE